MLTYADGCGGAERELWRQLLRHVQHGRSSCVWVWVGVWVRGCVGVWVYASGGWKGPAALICLALSLARSLYPCIHPSRSLARSLARARSLSSLSLALSSWLSLSLYIYTHMYVFIYVSLSLSLSLSPALSLSLCLFLSLSLSRQAHPRSVSRSSLDVRCLMSTLSCERLYLIPLSPFLCRYVISHIEISHSSHPLASHLDIT
jgi:hypothetical protein